MSGSRASRIHKFNLVALKHQQRAVTPRYDGVDLLRGFSILAVILLHTYIRMNFAGVSIQKMLPYWLFHLLFRNGGNGVTVFFAISGFLITFTSLRRFGSLAEIRPRTFYRIRFARIAPLLLLLLLALSILHLTHASGFRISAKVATLPQALFAALTFHINWLEASAHWYLPANWDVLWSLSVEEVFYLFFPLMTFLLFRVKWGRQLFIALLLGFVAMGPFARTVWTINNDIWRDSSYLGGMDSIALGCLCAMLTAHLLRSNNPGQSRRYLLIALEIIGAALILWIALWPRWHWMRYLGRSGLDDNLLALGTCLVMLASVLCKSVGSRWTAPIRWFGRHSYEVYMTHEFIVVWATLLYVKLHRGPLSLWVIAILSMAAFLGFLIARYFSEPMNRCLRGAAPPQR